jgi:hypothetical protein
VRRALATAGYSRQEGVYDAKTIESITDHIAKGYDSKRSAHSSPTLSNTYQRYIWSQPIQSQR